MTNFVVTDYCSAPLQTAALAAAALETYLETVATTQTIDKATITKHGDMFIAWAVHHTTP